MGILLVVSGILLFLGSFNILASFVPFVNLVFEVLGRFFSQRESLE